MITRGDLYLPVEGLSPSAEVQSGHRIGFARRHWVLFVVLTTLSLTVGLTLHYQSEPRYTARTDVVVLAVSDLATESSRPADVSIDSAVQVLLSDRVLGETARALEYPGRSSGLLNDMTISPIVNSRILRIYVSSLQPEVAYNAVNTLAEDFLRARQVSLLAADNTRSESIQAQIESIDLSLEQLDNRVFLTDDSAADSTAELTDERAALQTELAAIAVNVPEPGYISHMDPMPTDSGRTGLPIIAASSVALGFALAALIGVWRDRRTTPRRRLNQPAQKFANGTATTGSSRPR
ncbi:MULTISPECIES: hypothetical protein [unclassified Arthrobacter]|uniref:hypothetical protein n=1 Tax=unclassified Arthrobacter TaxID=235627 RepID=UPI001491616F|nr:MULTISPECIES: hypothetical protein [unclassified Arthrobacter]MBE0009082.1 hypothetical protein [Arthrobacter sp. AET 35A]NOJ62788.1 hypothetical protein [Arthrobacter sp. 147(2020)]